MLMKEIKMTYSNIFNFLLTTVQKQFNEGGIVLPKKKKQSDSHWWGKNNYDLNFIPYIEINLKGVTDLNAKLKNYKT